MDVKNTIICAAWQQSMKGMLHMNREGYKDPTAEQAIHNVTKKPWELMTAAEIAKIKKERCQYCKYAARVCTAAYGFTAMHCDYIGQTGHMRGCRPDECDKFVQARKKRGRKPKKTKKGSGTSE